MNYPDIEKTKELSQINLKNPNINKQSKYAILLSVAGGLAVGDLAWKRLVSADLYENIEILMIFYFLMFIFISIFVFSICSRSLPNRSQLFLDANGIEIVEDFFLKTYFDWSEIIDIQIKYRRIYLSRFRSLLSLSYGSEPYVFLILNEKATMKEIHSWMNCLKDGEMIENKVFSLPYSSYEKYSAFELKTIFEIFWKQAK